MPKIVWTETAINDLNRHYDFIKLNNTDAAARAIQAIVSSGESLQQNPRRGAIVDYVDSSRKLGLNCAVLTLWHWFLDDLSINIFASRFCFW